MKLPCLNASLFIVLDAFTYFLNLFQSQKNLFSVVSFVKILAFSNILRAELSRLSKIFEFFFFSTKITTLVFNRAFRLNRLLFAKNEKIRHLTSHTKKTKILLFCVFQDFTQFTLHTNLAKHVSWVL